jgi:arabinofuranosyltransferase
VLALIMMLIAAPRLAPPCADRGGRRTPAGRLSDLPDGLLRLLVPGTALAKDAAGDKWAQGMIYLANFSEPYALWAPVVLLVPLGLLLMAARRRPSFSRPMLAPNYGRVAQAVQSPAAVVVFIVVSGLLQAFYWIRQGGDFMHGRVLLAPLFCLLAPVAVAASGASRRDQHYSRETGYWLAVSPPSALWMGTAGWALWAANTPGNGRCRHPGHLHGHRRRAPLLRAGHRVMRIR